MKIKQIVIIVLGGLIAMYLINTLYQVLQISAFNPPMKEYNFTLSSNKLLRKLKHVDENDSTIILKIKDTTGSTETGLKYYADINLKQDTATYTFNFFIKESKKGDSKLGLVGAFDNIHNLGGYNKQDKEMKSLINIFETQIVTKINYTP